MFSLFWWDSMIALIKFEANCFFKIHLQILAMFTLWLFKNRNNTRFKYYGQSSSHSKHEVQHAYAIQGSTSKSKPANGKKDRLFCTHCCLLGLAISKINASSFTVFLKATRREKAPQLAMLMLWMIMEVLRMLLALNNITKWHTLLIQVLFREIPFHPIFSYL